MLPVGKTSTKRVPRPKVQHIKSIPAPVDGLNARDSLAAMPPTSAYQLINWIPQRYGVRSRKGYSEWATGMDGPVGTIMSYFPPTATIPTTQNFQVAPTTLPGKTFASTDGHIYDISSSGAAPAAVVTLSGTANAGSVSATSFANSAGGWLLACSETDGYYTYDGTTWVKVTLGGGAAQVSVSDPTKFVACCVWKHRVYFVIKNTAKIAYLPTDQIYGAAAEFDLGPLLQKGGALAWIATWTIDAGTGIDDYLVIASENGDVVIYKGTDPASASTFAHVGTFNVGEVPKGRQGFAPYGGDLLIISNLGIVPLSYVTRGGSNVLGTTTGDITADIAQLFSDTISQTFNFYGWQMENAPRENLLIITVPAQGGLVPTQFALNSSSNRWCLFNNMPMTCIKSCANWPLFGTADGRVCIAFTNFTDNNLLNGTVGNPIAGLIAPAFSYFQDAADISAQKHFLMVQPTFIGLGQPGYSLKLNTNFNTTIPLPPALAGASVGALWGTALWDQGLWGGSQQVYKKWSSVTGVGYTGELTLNTLINADTTLVSIDYMFEIGGPM